MRRGVAWLVTVPIALAGVVAAHSLANVALGSPEGAGELFASGESGRGLLPLVGAFAAGLVVLGLAGQVMAPSGKSERGGLVALPFACLPPFAFAALELIEAHVPFGGGVGSVLNPTFALGLALQLPFALCGYLVARLL